MSLTDCLIVRSIVPLFQTSTLLRKSWDGKGSKIRYLRRLRQNNSSLLSSLQ